MGANHILQKIEDLIVGSGASEFRELERMVDVFCPFEAIGMVRQEIRHSNFLAYILDPNRPHVFGTKFLEGLLALIIENANDDLIFSRMDLHFIDISNIRILREWRNIDILIEFVKSPSMTNGMVVAIELKIDAQEHSGQLKRYKAIIEEQYPKAKWDPVFVFLTKDRADPSVENQQDWIPIGLADFIERLQNTHETHGFSGPSSDLFMAYTKMLGRHILENEKLKELTRKLWDKHQEALQILMDHKPDMRSDILDILWARRTEMALELSTDDFTLVNDTSSRSYMRFTVKEWENIKPMQSGDKSWLESAHLLALEIHSCEEKNSGEIKFKVSYVMGPGIQEYRVTLYEHIVKACDSGQLTLGRRRKNISPKFQHLSSDIVYSDIIFKNMDEETDPKIIAGEMIRRIKSFLNETLPVYDRIIRQAFS